MLVENALKRIKRSPYLIDFNFKLEDWKIFIKCNDMDVTVGLKNYFGESL